MFVAMRWMLRSGPPRWARCRARAGVGQICGGVRDASASASPILMQQPPDHECRRQANHPCRRAAGARSGWFDRLCRHRAQGKAAAQPHHGSETQRQQHQRPCILQDQWRHDAGKKRDRPADRHEQVGRHGEIRQPSAFTTARGLRRGRAAADPPSDRALAAVRATQAGQQRHPGRISQVLGSVTPTWPWYLPPRSL